MTDVKALLKEARKLIDEKNYKEAQECCKNILRKDKQNYLGLVLLGKSFQDADQAPLAFQKAIACKPDNALAWQGLANYYERKEDNEMKNKLFPIYDKILKLQLENEKTLETVTKIGQLGCVLKNSEAISILIHFLHNNKKMDLTTEAQRQLLDLIQTEVPCYKYDVANLVNICNEIYEESPSDSIELIIGKIILQNENFSSAVSNTLNLKFFTVNVVLREMFCKYLCDKYIEQNSFLSFDIESHIEIVIKGIENSKYPGLLKSIICYDKKLYLEAYKQCVPLVNYQQADITEATLIIKCAIMLKKWNVVQKLVNNFLTKVKDSNFSLVLHKFLFLSLGKQEKWQQAIVALKDVSIENMDKCYLALLAQCYLELDKPVNNLTKFLEGSEYQAQVQALILLKQKQYRAVIDLLEKAEPTCMNLFYLGKAYWELKSYEKCLVTLLKAAKVDAEYAETFLYLGHYYNIHKQDFEKARKCYEKAYSLNVNNEIIKNLSEIYVKLNLEDIDFNLLLEAEKSMQITDSWIYFRLGLYYLKKKEWENAIASLRNVIKSDQSNATAFECLADAYYCRGSYSSSLRAYQKIMVLDPKKSSHCLCRMGFIHSMLTQHDDAIVAFKKVLNIEPNSILALKGIGETWFKIANKKMTSKLYGSARDCAQEAVNFLTKAVSIQKQYSCLWKLLGDVLIFITKLPDKFVHAFLGKSILNSASDVVKKEKSDIYLHAISCYSYVIRLKQQPASYDLALAYFSYYLVTQDLSHCNIAFNLALACIKYKPSNWHNWNLLGKICLCIKKYDIAQHCFIKALLNTRKWSLAEVWCNLGLLYIKLKLYKLANYCFWRGQSTSPSYPQSWIGQGLIAEIIREEEAMDLFRHATRLGYHSESALGYADWVARTLKRNTYKNNLQAKYEIEGLYAIPYSLDLMEWLITFEPKNSCALTVLGILQERSGLLRAASISFERALSYADESKKNIAHLNMGRILLRLEKYEEAITAYKNITEASFDSTCGLALALLKQGQFEESYSAYNTALEWLSNDSDEKADLLVAMAGIMYIFKGADDAKTLLFHSIQVSHKKPTANSLFAICSLGLLHTDQNLSKLALSELKKYELDDDYGYHIGFLKSYLLVQDENITHAVKILSDSIHEHPSNSLLWLYMAQCFLLGDNSKASIASCCAQRALILSYSSNCLHSAKMLAVASIAEYTAGHYEKSILLGKTGHHLYPYQAESWAALLFAILPNKKSLDLKDWLLSGAGHIRRNLSTSRALSRWVSLLERKLNK